MQRSPTSNSNDFPKEATQSGLLKDILVCPYDQATLLRSHQHHFKCCKCSRIFPIVSGTINFLSYEPNFEGLSYVIPWHPIPKLSPPRRLSSKMRTLPLYCRLLLTSDHFSLLLERKIFKETRRRSLILDIGCREGTNLLLVGGRKSVCFGIDVDLHGVSYANSVSPRNSIAFLASGTRIPFSNGVFSLIICTEVIEHILNSEDLISEIARVSSRGAKLILTTPSGDIVPKPYPLHHRHYKASELQYMLCREFVDINVTPVIRNCRSRKTYWRMRDRYSGKARHLLLLNFISNLIYYLSGYQKPEAVTRSDVTDASLIIEATRK